MRKWALQKLQKILKRLAKALLRKYHPLVVGITGSVGKTSTKLAAAAVLNSKYRTRMPAGNLNNELGLPLAIIGSYDSSGGAFFWLKAIGRALAWLVFRLPYPEAIVLEYGADRPGDIGYLLEIVRPEIAVVTAVGATPVHVEFYNGAEEVAAEKSRLVRSLNGNGFAVLNYDDPYVFEMKEKTKSKVITFGFKEGAAVRISGFENKSEDGRPTGIVFKLEYGGGFVPVRIDGILGRSHAYAAAAAAAVGVSQGLNLVQVSEALALYPGERGRTKILPGRKGSYLIDDTYNASPLSTWSALEILQGIPAPRKIAVLGDMSELGKYTSSAHEDTGAVAAGTVNVLVTVGAKAKFIAKGAIEKGMPEEAVLSFDSADEAKKEVQDLIKPGDLILIKGSQSARMEKIVLEVMAEPEMASKLLVRQYGHWLRG